MGLVQVYIPDDLEKRLRTRVPAKKGALSEFVAKAIEEKLEREESK